MSDTSDSLSFNYTIREADYARAIRAHMLTSKVTWALWIVFGALTAYVLLVGLFNVGHGGKTPLSFGADVLIFSSIGAAMWAFHWLPPRMAMRKSPSVGVEEEITLFDDRIVILSRLGRDELWWPHFKKVDETPDFFLLHPHEGNFYPLPKQYFVNAVELDRFRQKIRKHIPNFHEH